MLPNLQIKSFTTRDEQEVAGYAEVTELVFSSWQDVALTENHIKQLHRDLLTYSEKDAWHRGNFNRKVEREKLVLAALPELSLQIVEFAREHGRITMGDAIRLTGSNRNTLKQHFRALVERGHLGQHGAVEAFGTSLPRLQAPAKHNQCLHRKRRRVCAEEFHRRSAGDRRTRSLRTFTARRAQLARAWPVSSGVASFERSVRARKIQSGDTSGRPKIDMTCPMQSLGERAQNPE